MAEHAQDMNTRWDNLAGRTVGLGLVLAVVGIGGAIALGAGADDGWASFTRSSLVATVYAMSFPLGAFVFVMIQHVTRSGWSVVIRRLAEIVMGTLPVLALLTFAVAVLGMGHLYSWSDPAKVAADELYQWKQPYLNPTFFTIRMVVYLVVWTAMVQFFWSRSVRQDASGDPKLTIGMEKFSAPGIIIYALTVTFASVDLIMSIEAHWFSTIFGVYFFAGCIVSFFGLIAVLSMIVQGCGKLKNQITIEHYHDIGKLLFGFTVFWAYIAFSQYMLIWYGNIPEETGWFFHRQQGPWTLVSLVLLFGHFVLPFLLLISRVPKRRPALLVVLGAWVVAIHWVDVYYLILPRFGEEYARPGLMDAAATVGAIGVLVVLAALRARGHSLVPARDPRLDESLRFENA